MKRHAFPLALTATLASLVLAGCGDDDEPTSGDDPASTPASETTDASQQTDATTTTSEPSSSGTTDTATETTTVPVFFVGDTPNGPALFAEEREVEADNPAAESLALLEAGDILDPDYRTLVPADSIATDAAADAIGDEVFAIEVADEQWTQRPAGMSKVEAKLAVQQLAYTLDRGVDFYLDGEHVSYLGVPGTVEQADPLYVRGLVNVFSPAEGATVDDTFTARGEASSFEATVPWQVRDESGEVVLDGFSTAEGWIDGLYPWQTTVDVSELAPGTYTFAAMTDDPSGGAEGAGPTEDTKTIVVE